VLGLQWHWLSSDKATGTAKSENISGYVQGLRWQGKNYRRRYLKGLPRLRALARTTVIERFNTIAARAADVPASISAVKCST
jgi:hypothetical protein